MTTTTTTDYLHPTLALVQASCEAMDTELASWGVLPRFTARFNVLFSQYQEACRKDWEAPSDFDGRTRFQPRIDRLWIKLEELGEEAQEKLT